MEKKLYAKPFMGVEKFVPNEFVTACWFVLSGNCYDNLVHDIYNFWGEKKPNGNWNPGAGDEALARGHGTNHRIPSEQERSFKEEEVPIPIDINDYQNYWDGPNTWTMNADLQNKITTPIYHIKYDGVDHYFKHYETSNHS